MGPLTELVTLEGDSPQQAAITFAGRHWYAAWGDQGSNTTLVQRFTADGQSDGQALRIEGTMPHTLLGSSYRDGQILLFGYVGPRTRRTDPCSPCIAWISSYGTEARRSSSGPPAPSN